MREFHRKIGILRYLLPTYYALIIFDYAKELDNYMFFEGQLRKINEDGLADRKNWRIPQIANRLSFVVNLIPENLLMDKASLDEYERLSLSNEVLKVQNELVPYQLYDLCTFKYTRILTNEYYGYGVDVIFRNRIINKRNNIYLGIYTFAIALLIFLIV